MRRALAGAALAAALAAGCGRHRAPQAVGDLLPPDVVAVYPAPRAAGVPYDAGPFWAELATPLDSTTVSARTVYLKIDDARHPITARYDAATRRIVITPLAPLALRTVYTVELSTQVRTVDGVPFPRTYFWQFSTNSLHRPAVPVPADGTTGESPFVTLLWSGNTDSPDGVRYQIYAGADSARVAARGDSAIGVSVETERCMPRVRWAEGARTWWSLRLSNLTTGEVVDGPVWRFDTLGPGLAPVDSTVVDPSEWGYQLTNINRGCSSSLIITGNIALMRFLPTALAGSNARLAGMRLVMNTTTGFPIPPAGAITIWGLAGPYQACGTIWNTTPPSGDTSLGALAAVRPDSGTVVVFQSDAFTAHFEDVQRHGYLGYVLVSGQQYRFDASGGSLRAPKLIVSYYRAGAAPQTARR